MGKYFMRGVGENAAAQRQPAGAVGERQAASAARRVGAEDETRQRRGVCGRERRDSIPIQI